MIIRFALLFNTLFCIGLAMAPALARAAEESPRVELERPADWLILSFLALVIIGFYMLRRMTAEQKNRRIMLYYLRNPDSKVRSLEFFKAISYVAGHPKKFKTVQKNYDLWHKFHQEYPNKLYGLYATSLLSASLAAQGLKEGLLPHEKAWELLERSHAQSLNMPSLKVHQSAFLKLVIAQGHLMLTAMASDEASAEPFFKKARWNLLGALSGELQIFQMIGILESLASLHRAMAEKSGEPLPYFKQALDYLHMALALNPTSRAVFTALGPLCGAWLKYENDEQNKARLQQIIQGSRLAGYELEAFEKDMWLLRLSVIMNSEKTVRGKLGEMLDAQEEKLYEAMCNDSYLERYRDKSWFRQLANQAMHYSR